MSPEYNTNYNLIKRGINGEKGIFIGTDIKMI
jgi:hypothetical protein